MISNQSCFRYWTVIISDEDPEKYFSSKFDLVFGFHGCSIKYLGVWMVSRDGCLKVAGSHKHSTAIVLESKTKVVWYKQPKSSIWVREGIKKSIFLRKKS